MILGRVQTYNDNGRQKSAHSVLLPLLAASWFSLLLGHFLVGILPREERHKEAVCTVLVGICTNQLF